MTEYFIQHNSFAAPFFSDSGSTFIEADTPEAALEKFAASYTHPCGLYAAFCYRSSDAFHKGEKALAKWLCNHEIEKTRLTRDTPGYSYLGHGPGDFEISGHRHVIENPKDGRVVPNVDA